MVDDRLPKLIGGLVALERSRRVAVLERELRAVRDDFTMRGALGHGRLPLVIELVCADELEYRAKAWLEILRRAFLESSTPWTPANAEQARQLLSVELVDDWNGVLDRYRASVAPHDPSRRSGALDTAKERAEAQITHEIELSVLGQDRARIPVTEQLTAPRYQSVYNAWINAQTLSADARNAAQCAREAVGAVEQLARIVVQQPTATLGACINRLKQAKRIDAALLKGIEELWSWTSNEPGVRHGATSDGGPTHVEAHYVLKLAEAALLLLLSVDAA